IYSFARRWTLHKRLPPRRDAKVSTLPGSNCWPGFVISRSRNSGRWPSQCWKNGELRVVKILARLFLTWWKTNCLRRVTRTVGKVFTASTILRRRFASRFCRRTRWARKRSLWYEAEIARLDGADAVAFRGVLFRARNEFGFKSNEH